MARHLGLLCSLGLVASLVAACSSSGVDDAESSGDALSRRTGEPSEPRGSRTPAPKPPRAPGVPAPTEVGPPTTPPPAVPTACCQPVTVEVQRAATRLVGGVLTPPACGDLPGAYVEAGVTYVDGAGGRWSLATRATPAGMPASLAQGACVYTWYPRGGCAYADRDKLQLHENDWLFTVSGAPICYSRGTPQGLGRCEVCGVTAQNHMWAVLPSDWSSFSFWAGGERHSVTLDPGVHGFEADLGYALADELVTVYLADGAPAVEP